jgi:hypothetical protein
MKIYLKIFGKEIDPLLLEGGVGSPFATLFVKFLGQPGVPTAVDNFSNFQI